MFRQEYSEPNADSRKRKINILTGLPKGISRVAGFGIMGSFCWLMETFNNEQMMSTAR